MNKEFEKIIEKLEEEKMSYFLTIANTGDEKLDCAYEQVGDALDNAIEIVNQEAEQYNNGWIPCSERLPEDDSICIVTVEYPNNETVVDYGWFNRKSVCWFVGMQEFRTSNILAWQQLPEPYKERD